MTHMNMRAMKGTKATKGSKQQMDLERWEE